MTTTRVAKELQGCRSTTRTKLLTAGLVASLVAVLSGLPATAGTSTNAEMSDVAGDANFFSVAANDQRDTRPVSWANGDLREVWFETAYSTSKVVNPSTGSVSRVEHRPTALVVRIKTEAPVRPLSPWSALRFKVNATLPACQATIELLVAGSGPNFDSAEIRPASPSTNCGGDNGAGAPINIITSPVKPTYDGSVSTLTFPLSHALISQVLKAGTALSQTKASTIASLPSVTSPVALDQTGAGRSFTIGQDVPPDIDCSAAPTNPACHA